MEEKEENRAQLGLWESLKQQRSQWRVEMQDKFKRRGQLGDEVEDSSDRMSDSEGK